MAEIFRGYVPTKDKKPTMRFGSKTGARLLTLKEARAHEEYAGILNGEYSVVDVDDPVEAEKTLGVVETLGLNVRVVNTTRGKHFIFRNNPKIPLKGSTRQTNALGFTFDIRTGTNQYIVCKVGGKEREVAKDFDESRPISEFHPYFRPIRSDRKFTSLSDGDGRNGKLFAHIATLAHNGFSREEIRDIARLINEHAFDEPLGEEEMAKILRDESFEGLDSLPESEEFPGASGDYRPADFTDLGMAKLFSERCLGRVRHNESIGWLTWDGKAWRQGDHHAKKLYFAFLDRVSEAARAEFAEALGSPDDKDLAARAKAFTGFALSMRSGPKIANVLRLVQTEVHIDAGSLDANPFELNTPGGIVDLRTGRIGPHRPESFCTKTAARSPSEAGGEMFSRLLDTVTGGDQEYARFLRAICGACAIGKVYSEALVIAFGDGQNGKSTLFNAVADMLGDYSGKIPAESLTTKGRNTKVDLAELFGKRMVLASETEEGQRLSTQMLKQIASTDKITGERKYRDPMVFAPTHTAILYTNFLPRLDSLDLGTRRRIIVCPFTAVIGNPEKDYMDRMTAEDGGAIVAWIVEGAKDFCSLGYSLPPCKAADDAKRRYISDNNWAERFVSDCCAKGESESQGSSELYRAYRQWCQDTGEFPKRNSDFNKALEALGFTLWKTAKRNVWKGISLDPSRSVGKSPGGEFL